MSNNQDRNGQLSPDTSAATSSQGEPVTKTYIDSLTLSNEARLVPPEELKKRARRNSKAEKQRIDNALASMLNHYKDALV